MRKSHYSLAGICFLVILFCFSCTKTVDEPSGALKVTGPIEVTSESYPFNAADHSTVPQDLAAFNYIEEEYFVSGKSNVYDYDAEGNVVVRTPDAPYTTRIHIRRPADKSKFSGNVVVELNNPTAMHDMDLQWMFCRDFFLENGDIWVGITVKPVAVKALKVFNPERYVSLSMDNPQPPDQRCEPEPDDTTPETENGLVWDMVSQVGALLKSDSESNPVRDYKVEYLIATGYSQTAGYLVTYINLIHPLDSAKLADGSPIYDGYMLGDGDGFMFPINQCADDLPPGESSPIIKPRGVPIISVVTQGILNMTMVARRPDSDTPEDQYRRYEIPGSAHVNQKSMDNKPCDADTQKAGVPAIPANCAGVNEHGVTDFPIEFFMNSAYNNLYTWLRTGTPPPRSEPIMTEKVEGTDEILIKLDEHGNAIGGVRSPYVEYPVATYYGQSQPLDEGSAFFCMLAGYKEPFDHDKIKSLYPTHEDYLNKVNGMVDKMVKERLLTESDGERIKKEADANLVYTSNGPIRGRTETGGVHVFKGVRYGAPPIGNLRFKPPVRPASWKEPIDAYVYGKRAMQGAGLPGASNDLPEVSEDCLFLNVWTPGLDDKGRPVMVWLHGGGFSSGSGGDSFCEGKNLARKGDVVVVTVNHRLNVFGFLQLGEEWGPDYASSGQAGMLDIVMSLEWVRDNITRFGGDPTNVTIFGESGGGRKVAMLMAMPPAAGLFHKAIIQSGSGLDAPSKADAVALGRELLKELGIAEGDVEALMSTDAQRVFDSQPPPSLSAISPPDQLTVPARGFVPCVDGVALQRKPFIPDAPAISAHIPLMIGSNKDEMSIFRSNDPKFGTYTEEDFVKYVREVLPGKAEEMIPALRSAFPDYSPTDLIVVTESLKGYWIATVFQAERKVAQAAAPVYVYLLAWETKAENGRLRAHHALDVPLVFNNIGNMRSMVGPGPEPQKMADVMSSSWIAFARTGNPHTEGLPTWPAYDLENRATMVFDGRSYVRNDPYEKIRRILIHPR